MLTIPEAYALVADPIKIKTLNALFEEFYGISTQ